MKNYLGFWCAAVQTAWKLHLCIINWPILYIISCTCISSVDPTYRQKLLVLWILKSPSPDALLLVTDFPSGNSLIGVYVLRGFAVQLTIYAKYETATTSVNLQGQTKPSQIGRLQSMLEHAMLGRVGGGHTAMEKSGCRYFLLHSGVLRLNHIAFLYLPLMPVKKIVAY